MNKNKVYFPNLNGLRFIAAFLVIVHHIEQIKNFYNIPNLWDNPFIRIIGKLGVVLFFVLSGFLITYLLLIEEKNYKRIDVKKFYMRRILRIWPLYYLIIIFAMFVFPHLDVFSIEGYGQEVLNDKFIWKLLFYVIIMPNIVLGSFGAVPYASHTWSIGVEEQFYLVWPVLLNFIKNYRLFLMIGIVLGYIFIKISLSSIDSPNFCIESILKNIKLFPISCMAIGAIYSILLFKKSNYLKYILNNKLFYSSIIFVLILILNGIKIPYIHYEFYSLFFGIIILNFSSNKNIIFSLENRLFNYLGNISYGLYMYHPIAIVLSIYIRNKIDVSILSDFIIYILSIVVTIGLAAISYEYFEQYFLKFKKQFSKISSGNMNNL